MSCKIKKFKSTYKIDKILENYNSIKSSQTTLLTENYQCNNINIKHINKTLTESAIPTTLSRYCICMSLKPKNIILYESSVVNQHTQPTEPVLLKIMDTCELTEDNIYVEIQNDDLLIADYILFLLPVTILKNILNNMFNDIEKIMTICGYYLAHEPEIRYTEGYGQEYVVLYEPNEPEFIKQWLPEKLYHVTTVQLSMEILKTGFIPGTNDIFKYTPRIYFVDYVDGFLIKHIVRRYKKELLVPGTNNQAEYTIITINTPENIKFYKDYHMKNSNSYFTFEPIDKEYIDNIKIEKISSMLMELWKNMF